MKRRYVMAGFATVTLLLGALTTQQFLQLRQRESVNQAVSAVPATMTPQQFGNETGTHMHTQPAEVLFARATALLKGGYLDLAEKSLGILSQQPDQPSLAIAARYNLANGYLREALNADRASGRYRSLIELAKQRYRDLLAENPDHWDARYNLELALRMAPETESYEVDERGKPIKSVSVAFPGFEDRELP